MPATIWRSPHLDHVELLDGINVNVSVARHFHEEYQIGFVQGGALNVRSPLRAYQAIPQQLFVIPPGEVHTSDSARDVGWTYHMFYIAPHLIQKAAEERAGRARPLPSLQPLVTADASLAAPLLALAQAMQQQVPALEQQARLVVALARLIDRLNTDQPGERFARDEPVAIRRAIDYLEVHLADDVSLETLAREVGLSKYHLVHAFQRCTGVPPHTYQLQLRVSRARRLLAQGLPVARVATAVGFAHTSHLHRHFTRVLRFTPGAYRRMTR